MKRLPWRKIRVLGRWSEWESLNGKATLSHRHANFALKGSRLAVYTFYDEDHRATIIWGQFSSSGAGQFSWPVRSQLRTATITCTLRIPDDRISRYDGRLALQSPRRERLASHQLSLPCRRQRSTHMCWRTDLLKYIEKKDIQTVHIVSTFKGNSMRSGTETPLGVVQKICRTLSCRSQLSLMWLAVEIRGGWCYQDDSCISSLF